MIHRSKGTKGTKEIKMAGMRMKVRMKKRKRMVYRYIGDYRQSIIAPLPHTASHVKEGRNREK